MKIIVDAFGGDNAPLEVLKGCEAAVKSRGVDIILTGNREIIEKVIAENGIDSSHMTIVQADTVVEMEDEPTVVVRTKKDSSMMLGLSMLSEGQGDAFVSAGSTGALLAGATFIVKRIDGVKRAALAPLLPTSTGRAMLIDCGANVECKPEYLVQFAQMGSAYMEYVCGVKNPRVGLCNIGTEDCKGTELCKQTLPLLRETDLNFLGNVETREIPLGGMDVAVCDGFTGNIILKTLEGMAKFFITELKGILYKNTLTKLCALAAKGGLTALKVKMDPGKVGGTPFLGIRKPVVKAHGNSKADSIESSIINAADFAASGVIERLQAEFERQKV